MMKHNRLAGAPELLCAGCMALALFTDFALLDANNYKNWAAMTGGHTFAIFALTAAFAVLLHYAKKRFVRRGKGLGLLSLFLGAWWVMAQVYANKFRVLEPFATAGQALKVLVSFVGMSALYDLLLRMLDDVLMRGADIGPEMNKSRIAALYRAHPAALCGVFVLLCWTPHLLISYPAAMNWDTAMQVEQAIGLVPYDGNHPPFSTMIVGAAVGFGRMLGDVNLGLFAYVLVQAVAGAAVVGYAQATLLRLCAPGWLRGMTLAVCAFAPCYADNVTVILKDVPYAFASLLLACEMARLCVLEEKAYYRSRGFMLRWCIVGLVMTLFRNNGYGILIPAAAILAVRAVKSKKNVLYQCMALALPIVLSLAIGAGVRAVFHVQPGSVREGLSLPFQQTARFVSRHHEEIPEKERAIIREVIDYDHLTELYDPYISDPVKATIRGDVTNGELMAYFGVWAKQFWRDPLCYLQATLIQNALLFDPQTKNVAFFDVIGLRTETEELLGAAKPEALWALVDREMNLRDFLFALPGYGQMTSVGLYAILMLFCCVVIRRESLGGMGALLVIPVMTAVMIVLGPCLLWQDRYGFPIIYCMPIVLGCMAYLLRRRESEMFHP